MEETPMSARQESSELKGRRTYISNSTRVSVVSVVLVVALGVSFTAGRQFPSPYATKSALDRSHIDPPRVSVQQPRELDFYQSEHTAPSGSTKSHCLHSFVDTRGVVCVRDEVWHRILQTEEQAWARINASVRDTKGGDGGTEIIRKRPDGVDYESRYSAREHFGRRRDYLQAVWVPTLSCPEETRVGEVGDGGKWVCGAKTLVPPELKSKQDGCLIYSFGSNNMYGFETGMLEETGGECEIHIFDHTMTSLWNPPSSLAKSMHKFGVSSEKDSNSQMKSWGQIISMLGHQNRTINVLKIDVEGAEYSVLPEIFQAPPRHRPQQILVETHLTDPPRSMIRESDKLLLQFREAGYYMFHTEPNYNGALNFNEYSFIRLNSATRK